MKTAILRTIAGGLLTSLVLASLCEPKGQYLLPVACVGLSDGACAEATNLLREHIRQFPEIYKIFPDKWEVATDSELARIRSLYPTREGYWMSHATFVLFLEPGYGTLHTCAPRQIILTDEAAKSRENLAYIAGYVDGACEGTAQDMLHHARK